MANPGSSGQRWKLSKLISVKAHENKVIENLECGHTVISTWDSAQDAQGVADRQQRYIGKRQGCKECSRKV